MTRWKTTADRIISVAEAAYELDCSEPWIKRMCTSGQLRAKKIGKHSWAIDRLHVDALARHKAETGAIIARPVSKRRAAQL